MMRFQAALSTGLAAFLVVPAIVVGNDVGTLENALANTNRALELLAGMRTKLEAGDGATPGLVTSVTEPPILDARRRDDRLTSLRNDVSLLQTELELIENGTTAAPAGIPSVGETPGVAVIEVDGSAPLPPVHTGLDDATRRALRGLESEEEPGAADATTEKPTTQQDAPTQVSPEGAGYSANPVLHARACFHAGRYAQGANLLLNAKTDPKALYWRARCFEKLDRLGEAATDLRRVIELTKDEFERKRAETDLKFVEWKKGFVEKLEAEKGGKKKG